MNTNGTIYISQALMKKLNLSPQTEIKIRVGSLIVKSRLVVQDLKRKSYMLSPSLTQILHVKSRRHLKLRYDIQENMIHLGPTIGILSTFLPNKEEFDPTSIQAELIFLSNIGKTMPGQVYIFTPSSINWSNLTTRGYVYKQLSAERGIWVAGTYPLPDVVYDRIPSRSTEARTTIKNTKKKLTRLPYLKYFNPSFLNKWKVYELLINDPRLYPFIPETRSLTVHNLDEMLLKYKTLYIKPSNGSLGQGIIKLSKDDKDRLHYVVNRRGRVRSSADNSVDFMKKTRLYRGSKPYIVQQGISLATYKGLPFDLRIIFQKNDKGEWQIGKKFVRVAARGSNVSNLSSGGRVEKSKKVFRHLYQKDQIIEEKNQQISNLCKNIALTLEKSSKSNFGELGLDIGIDKNGFPWLIEVNSKPRKTTESDYSQALARKTFKRPLEYSSYLAGF